MLISNIIYKKLCIHRYEEMPYLGYLKYTDFKGLKYEKYEFTSKGQKMVGGFYYYDNYKKDSLVIFCHGIGGGYSSYMSEIEMLAQAGYKVLAFDYIGCCKSEGKDIISMTESLVNLNACLNSLKDKYDEQNISVMGHSWGGFAASNIIKYHPSLHAIIDISGFISIHKMLEGFIKGMGRILIKGIYKYEKKKNPSLYNSSAIETLQSCKAKVLIIHDELDNMVPYALSIKLLKEKVNNPNIKYIITKGKYHNPQYTMDACSYMRNTFMAFNEAIKKKQIKTLEQKKEFFKDVDWFRMTKQDLEIYKSILETLE